MGRQRVSHTTYLYDDDGRLVESVTVHDAKYTDDDLDAVLTWQHEDQMSCPGCGFPVDEAWVWDPDEYMDKRAAFKVQHRQCVPCALREQARDSYFAQRTQTGRPAYDPHGNHFFPVRTGDD